MLLKNSFLLSHISYILEFEFSWFHNTKQSSEISIVKIEMLLEFQNKRNSEVLINAFWIHLRIARYRFVKYRFVRYTFRFVRYRYPQYFVCLHSVFKTSSKYVFKTSSRQVFKTSSRHVFKTVSRHVFKTSSRCLCKTFSRRHQDAFEDVKLLPWRRFEDIFNINKCLLGMDL